MVTAHQDGCLNRELHMIAGRNSFKRSPKHHSAAPIFMVYEDLHHTSEKELCFNHINSVSSPQSPRGHDKMVGLTYARNQNLVASSMLSLSVSDVVAGGTAGSKTSNPTFHTPVKPKSCSGFPPPCEEDVPVEVGSDIEPHLPSTS